MEDKLNGQIAELKEIVHRLEAENNELRAQNASILDEYDGYQTEVKKEQIRNELLMREQEEKIKQMEVETSTTQELSQLVAFLQKEVNKKQVEIRFNHQNSLVSLQDQVKNIS